MSHFFLPKLPAFNDLSDGREAVPCFMAALESMCKEFAKVKAEVACIAVYGSEALIVGSEKGRAFLDARKDFQKEFINYCKPASTPEDGFSKNAKATTDCMDIESLQKSVEDLFCICYGKALGKSTPVPIPYEKMEKDPTAVTVCGLPKGVTVVEPLKYSLHTLTHILDNKASLSFNIKRPFIDRRRSKRKENEIARDAEAAFAESSSSQVKTEPSDDTERPFELTTITIKEESEDQEYHQFNFQEDFLQNSEDMDTAGYFVDVSSEEEMEGCGVDPGTKAAATDRFDLMFAEDIQSFLQRSESKNTHRKTMCDIHNLQAYFCSNFNELRPIYNIPPVELCGLLSHYFLNVKKKDNSEYEPLTLRSIFQSIERYLKQKNYPTSISSDIAFKTTRDSLKLKQRELKTKGKGCKQNASDELTDELIHQLYLTKQLGPHNAHSLQNTMWLNNCIYFGIRGNNEMRQLRWGDVLLGEDEIGNEYLQYDREHQLRNHVGINHSDFRQRPKAYATPKNPEMCPVMNYKIFLHHRPSKMLEPTAPFYLAINWKPSLQQLDPQWYKNQPLGIHSIETILKTMVQRAGIRTKRRITNHSATKLLLQKLQEPNMSTITIHNDDYWKSDTQNNSEEYCRSKKAQHGLDGCLRSTAQDNITGVLCNASLSCVPRLPLYTGARALNNQVTAISPFNKFLGDTCVSPNLLCINVGENSSSSAITSKDKKRKFVVVETND